MTAPRLKQLWISVAIFGLCATTALGLILTA